MPQDNTSTLGGLASFATLQGRSYWIPGSYAPLASEKRNSFLRLLKNKAFKKEGTGSVSCNSVFVRYLGRLLNQEELMEPEATVQNP